MKRLFFFSILLAASLPTFSQHFDWVKTYSGNEPSDYTCNYIVSSVTDSHGNLYVAGQFANGASIDGHDLLPITPHVIPPKGRATEPHCASLHRADEGGLGERLQGCRNQCREN